MMRFYLGTMRCASIVLFVAALVSVVAGSLPALATVRTMAHDLYGQPNGMQSYIIVQAILAGVNNALFPFFGAALLWRIDRHWIRSPEKAE